MSNTNTNTNTNTTTTDLETIRTLHDHTHALETILNDPTNHTAQERIDAETALQTALNTANTQRLERLFTECDHADNPLQALLTSKNWSPYIARRKTDPKTGKISYTVMTRRARVNLLDYLKHAELKGVTLPTSVDMLRNLLESACNTLSAYVLASIQQDELSSVSVSNVKAGLYNFVSKLGISGLKVRNTDVRFLSMAVTRARDLGELAEITPAHLVPYLMDLVYVQNEELKYGFAAKESKQEQPSK